MTKITDMSQHQTPPPFLGKAFSPSAAPAEGGVEGWMGAGLLSLWGVQYEGETRVQGLGGRGVGALPLD